MANTPKMNFPLPTKEADGSTFLQYRTDLHDAIQEIDAVVGQLYDTPFYVDRVDWAKENEDDVGCVKNKPFYQKSDDTCVKVPFKYLPIYYISERKYSAGCLEKSLETGDGFSDGDILFILQDIVK